MTLPILVTSGTGTLEQLVVPRARDANCDVWMFSRSNHEAEEGIEFFTGGWTTDDESSPRRRTPGPERGDEPQGRDDKGPTRLVRR